MCIDHGGADVFVTEQGLNGTDIGTGLKEMSCKAVPKGMASNSFGDAGGVGRFFECPVDSALVKVMAYPLSILRIQGCP
jgi:hypothetical protein